MARKGVTDCTLTLAEFDQFSTTNAVQKIAEDVIISYPDADRWTSEQALKRASEQATKSLNERLF